MPLSMVQLEQESKILAALEQSGLVGEHAPVATLDPFYQELQASIKTGQPISREHLVTAQQNITRMVTERLNKLEGHSVAFQAESYQKLTALRQAGVEIGALHTPTVAVAENPKPRTYTDVEKTNLLQQAQDLKLGKLSERSIIASDFGAYLEDCVNNGIEIETARLKETNLALNEINGMRRADAPVLSSLAESGTVLKGHVTGQTNIHDAISTNNARMETLSNFQNTLSDHAVYRAGSAPRVAGNGPTATETHTSPTSSLSSGLTAPTSTAHPTATQSTSHGSPTSSPTPHGPTVTTAPASGLTSGSITPTGVWDNFKNAVGLSSTPTTHAVSKSTIGTSTAHPTATQSTVTIAAPSEAAARERGYSIDEASVDGKAPLKIQHNQTPEGTWQISIEGGEPQARQAARLMYEQGFEQHRFIENASGQWSVIASPDEFTRLKIGASTAHPTATQSTSHGSPTSPTPHGPTVTTAPASGLTSGSITPHNTITPTSASPNKPFSIVPENAPSGASAHHASGPTPHGPSVIPTQAHAAPAPKFSPIPEAKQFSIFVEPVAPAAHGPVPVNSTLVVGGAVGLAMGVQGIQTIQDGNATAMDKAGAASFLGYSGLQTLGVDVDAAVARGLSTIKPGMAGAGGMVTMAIVAAPTLIAAYNSGDVERMGQTAGGLTGGMAAATVLSTAGAAMPLVYAGSIVVAEMGGAVVGTVSTAVFDDDATKRAQGTAKAQEGYHQYGASVGAPVNFSGAAVSAVGHAATGIGAAFAPTDMPLETAVLMSALPNGGGQAQIVGTILKAAGDATAWIGDKLQDAGHSINEKFNQTTVGKTLKSTTDAMVGTTLNGAANLVHGDPKTPAVAAAPINLVYKQAHPLAPLTVDKEATMQQHFHDPMQQALMVGAALNQSGVLASAGHTGSQNVGAKQKAGPGLST